MVNYHEQLMSKSVTAPATEISVVDKEHILLKPSTCTLEKSGITNQAGDLCYKIMKKTLSFKNEKVITDVKDNPLLVIKNGSSSSDIEIFSGTDDKKVLASIVKGESFTDSEKYTVTYFNQVTEKKETLAMNCAASYRSCGIFNGVEEEGAPLICRINEIKIKSFFSSKSKFDIEIAQGVDRLFMCAFALCLNELKTQSQMDDIAD
ncbi:hypothetical protein PIROE2DRAFT_61981 [Piromyces sp. E2]|nr:hypothetical protein PIROE2DRAFT_61981 [Piromyces sp. E2]|eukprot:OUM62296.1 hypothetical protein PIROE2DRAFT_61981 [Piromyces sp. E2]